jgi:hypothetical protein
MTQLTMTARDFLLPTECPPENNLSLQFIELEDSQSIPRKRWHLSRLQRFDAGSRALFLLPHHDL